MRALARRLYRRSRADRWSSLFGQVAVYSFVITAITGVFLLFYYKPSMTQVSYHGSYRKLDGVDVHTRGVFLAPDGRAVLLTEQDVVTPFAIDLQVAQCATLLPETKLA